MLPRRSPTYFVAGSVGAAAAHRGGRAAVTLQQRPSVLLSKRDDGDHLATMPVWRSARSISQVPNHPPVANTIGTMANARMA
jgi:hypothetical protein